MEPSETQKHDLNKLQKLLSLLGDKEKKAFMELLNPTGSDEFNALALCLAFYLQAGDKIDREALSRVIRPGKPFNQNAIDQIESKLLSRLQDFLVLQKLKANAPEFELHLIEELNRRGEVNYIDHYLRKVMKANDQMHDQSPESYLHEFEAEMERIKNQVGLGERHIHKSLAGAQLSLDRYYWLKSMQIRVAMEGASKFVASSSEVEVNAENTVERMMQALGQSRLYTALLLIEKLLLGSESEDSFKELLEMVFADPHLFSAAILQDLRHHLLNHCVRRLRAGDSSYNDPYKVLTNSLLQAEAEDRRANLRPALFKNSIERALQMGEQAYAEEIFGAYQNHIPAKFRTEVVEYNAGIIAFYKGNYREANAHFFNLNIVMKVGDVFYQIDAKVYWIWTSLLTSETNGLNQFVHAFKKFLRDSKLISVEIKNGYLDLVGHILKIYRWRRHRKEPAKRVLALQMTIEQATNLPKKKLLLDHLHRWTGYS